MYESQNKVHKYLNTWKECFTYKVYTFYQCVFLHYLNLKIGQTDTDTSKMADAYLCNCKEHLVTFCSKNSATPCIPTLEHITTCKYLKDIFVGLSNKQ